MNGHRQLSVDGWVQWELIDRDGQVVGAGEQHNLMLNQGLDQMAVYGLGTFDPDNGYSGIAQYFAVGTGATAPDVAQTGLVNEIARSGTAYQSTVTTYVSPGVYRRATYREIDFGAGNGNLTEWGFSPVGSAGPNLAVRELFRDAQGNTITVTKTSAQKLRMKYTLEYRFGPVVQTAAAQFAIAGIATPITGVHTLMRNLYHGTDSTNADYLLINALLTNSVYGQSVTSKGDVVTLDYSTQTFINTPYWQNTPQFNLSYELHGMTTPAYAAGSFARAYSMNYPTGQGNFTIRGWGITSPQMARAVNSANFYFPGWLYFIDNGKEITTKTADRTLTVTGFGLTWGRA